MENQRQPYDKFSGKRIAFEELVKLIGQDCDYKFAIIDYGVDEELMAIAKTEGIDLTGYKHVIETSGTNHSQNRHGEKSNDNLSKGNWRAICLCGRDKNRSKQELSFSNSL